MKKQLKLLPSALQKLFWLRLFIGIVLFAFFIVTLTIIRELYICASLLIIGLVFFISAWYFLYDCSRGRYLCIVGQCRGAEHSKILRRLKYIYIEAEGKAIKIPIRKLRGKLFEGDTVKLYISVNAPILSCAEGYLINKYYAIEIGEK